jgi:hypothetical protein
MGALANPYANSALDHIFRTATWAKPTHNWISLWTVSPGDTGGGTEVSGGAYARVDLPPLDTNWFATQGGTSGASTGTSRTVSNAVVVTFPAPTLAWGTIVAVGSHSLISGGVMNIWAALATPIIIAAGDLAPTFQPGTLSFTFTAG